MKWSCSKHLRPKFEAELQAVKGHIEDWFGGGHREPNVSRRSRSKKLIEARDDTHLVLAD